MGSGTLRLLLTIGFSIWGCLLNAQTQPPDSTKAPHSGTSANDSQVETDKKGIRGTGQDNLNQINPQKEDTLPSFEEVLKQMEDNGQMGQTRKTNGNPPPPKKGQRLEIINANLFAFKEIKGRPIRRLIGDVHLRQDTTDFLCDSAYQYLDSNQIEAFSNVKIILKDTMSIASEFLAYSGVTKIAEFYRDVVLKKGKTRLYTNRLTYNRDRNFAVYSNGGKLTDGKNVLKSQRGYFYPNDKIAFFKGNVSLENEDYNVETDTLGYDTRNETAIFNAPTRIFDDGDNTIYTERGFYDTNLNLALFYQNPYMKDSTYRMEADTFYYDRNMDFGRAMGSLELTKLDTTIKVYGHYGEFEQIGNRVMITDSAYAVQVMETDTLYLMADTLWTQEDSVKTDSGKKTIRFLRAIKNVAFFMSSLQGSNDSLVYFMEDSAMAFYKDPYLWSGDQQMTGDTIRVFMKKQQIDSLWAGRDAFLISKEDTIGYNQIKGKYLSANFKKNKLHIMHIMDNAESMYYAKDSKDEYMGLNTAKCNSMTIRLKENKPSRITFHSEVTGNFAPLHEVLFKKKELEGFNWKPNRRPVKPQNVYIGTMALRNATEEKDDSVSTTADELKEILDQAEKIRADVFARKSKDSLGYVMDSLRAAGVEVDLPNAEDGKGIRKSTRRRDASSEDDSDEDKKSKKEKKKSRKKSKAKKKKAKAKKKAKRKAAKARKKAEKAAAKARAYEQKIKDKREAEENKSKNNKVTKPTPKEVEQPKEIPAEPTPKEVEQPKETPADPTPNEVEQPKEIPADPTPKEVEKPKEIPADPTPKEVEKPKEIPADPTPKEVEKPKEIPADPTPKEVEQPKEIPADPTPKEVEQPKEIPADPTPKEVEQPKETPADPTPKEVEQPKEIPADPTPKEVEQPKEIPADPTPKEVEQPKEIPADPTPKEVEQPKETPVLTPVNQEAQGQSNTAKNQQKESKWVVKQKKKLAKQQEKLAKKAEKMRQKLDNK